MRTCRLAAAPRAPDRIYPPHIVRDLLPLLCHCRALPPGSTVSHSTPNASLPQTHLIPHSSDTDPSLYHRPHPICSRAATRRRTPRRTTTRRRHRDMRTAITLQRGRAAYTTCSDIRALAGARDLGRLPLLIIMTSQGFTSPADAATSTFRIP